MIEVDLQPWEAAFHPAQGHLMWWGVRGSFWDITFIEYASKLQLDTLQDAIEEAIDLIAIEYNAPQLRSLIADIEICGSYAYGIQKPWSDFDIQLPAKDYEDQRKIEAIIANKSSLVKIVGYKLSMRIKHRIEIHYSVHDNKQYNEVYSLRERKLYNRKEGMPTSERHKRTFKSKKDKDGKEIGQYEIVDKNPSILDSDYWYSDGRAKI